MLVLSNLNDKECAINLSARLCYFGSMKIVGKDLTCIVPKLLPIIMFDSLTGECLLRLSIKCDMIRV